MDGGTRAAFDELLWHASEADDMDLILRIVDEMSDLGVKVRIPAATSSSSRQLTGKRYPRHRHIRT